MSNHSSIGSIVYNLCVSRGNNNILFKMLITHSIQRKFRAMIFILITLKFSIVYNNYND